MVSIQYLLVVVVEVVDLHLLQTMSSTVSKMRRAGAGPIEI